MRRHPLLTVWRRGLASASQATAEPRSGSRWPMPERAISPGAEANRARDSGGRRALDQGSEGGA